MISHVWHFVLLSRLVVVVRQINKQLFHFWKDQDLNPWTVLNSQFVPPWMSGIVWSHWSEFCPPTVELTRQKRPDWPVVLCVRNRMALLPSQAFYLLINNSGLASMSLTMAQVYKDHQDDDGFLYMTYASQEMFGHWPATTSLSLHTFL